MSIPHELPIDLSKTPENFSEWNDIELQPAHWDVIAFLRNHCEQQGTDSSARELLKLMVTHYHAEGGNKYLYSLFPRGPVVQACKIAGMRQPRAWSTG